MMLVPETVPAEPLKEKPYKSRAVCKIVALPAFPETVVWSPVLVPVAVPPPVAKSASVRAVLNCAVVPVIPTMEVWSPVFEPETETAPAPIVRTEVLATLAVRVREPPLTVRGLVTFSTHSTIGMFFCDY